MNYVDIIASTLNDFWDGLQPLKKEWEKQMRKAARAEGIPEEYLPYMAYTIYETRLPALGKKGSDALTTVKLINHHAEHWPFYSRLKYMEALPPVEVEGKIPKAIVRMAKALARPTEQRVTKAWRKALRDNRRDLYRRYRHQFDSEKEAGLRLWSLCEWALVDRVKGFRRYVEGQEAMMVAVGSFLSL